MGMIEGSKGFKNAIVCNFQDYVRTLGKEDILESFMSMSSSTFGP
jgi:hypothetical protein